MESKISDKACPRCSEIIHHAFHGRIRRHHINEKTVQNAVKEAVEKAGITSAHRPYAQIQFRDTSFTGDRLRGGSVLRFLGYRKAN